MTSLATSAPNLVFSYSGKGTNSTHLNKPEASLTIFSSSVSMSNHLTCLSSSTSASHLCSLPPRQANNMALTPLKMSVNLWVTLSNQSSILRPEDLLKIQRLKHTGLQIIQWVPILLWKQSKMPTLLYLPSFSLLISYFYCILCLFLLMIIVLFLKPAFPCFEIFVPAFVFPGKVLSLPPLWCLSFILNSSALWEALQKRLVFSVIYLSHCLLYLKDRGCLSLFPQPAQLWTLSRQICVEERERGIKVRKERELYPFCKEWSR